MNRMISRRAFLKASAYAILAAPLAVEAQQPGKVWRIGYLYAGPQAGAARYLEGFEQTLGDLGWVKGRNIAIEYRFGEGSFERLPTLATDLVRLGVDVFVAAGGPETKAAKQATRSIPIVFAAHGDPVGVGDVQTLARPGGNITGSSTLAPELGAKQLELLMQAVPRVSRIAVVWNAANPLKIRDWQELQRPAQTLGIVLESRELRRRADFERVFGEIKRQRPNAVLTLDDPLTFGFAATIADFMTKERLPATPVPRIR